MKILKYLLNKIKHNKLSTFLEINHGGIHYFRNINEIYYSENDLQQRIAANTLKVIYAEYKKIVDNTTLNYKFANNFLDLHKIVNKQTNKYNITIESKIRKDIINNIINFSYIEIDIKSKKENQTIFSIQISKNWNDLSILNITIYKLLKSKNNIRIYSTTNITLENLIIIHRTFVIESSNNLWGNTILYNNNSNKILIQTKQLTNGYILIDNNHSKIVVKNTLNRDFLIKEIIQYNNKQITTHIKYAYFKNLKLEHKYHILNNKLKFKYVTIIDDKQRRLKSYCINYEN